MSENMKIYWNRGSADVEWNGKRARFGGELGVGGFAASPKTMKWMFPERDIPVSEEERDKWICAINNYYENTKGESLFFLEDNEWDKPYESITFRIRTGILKSKGVEIKFSFPSKNYMYIDFNQKRTRFFGSWHGNAFWTSADSMKWRIPEKREATDVERMIFIQEVNKAYQKAPRKIRKKFEVVFFDARGKKIK